MVIALIVMPEGFPVAYEVLAGNTADKTTLGGFLQKIEDQYGKAGRIWIMVVRPPLSGGHGQRPPEQTGGLTSWA